MDEIVDEKELLQTDFIDVSVLNRMSLTLDNEEQFEPGAVVPKLWHWLFFLPRVKASNTGPDGHPKIGDFIPHLEGLDRRMWAGSRFKFHTDLIAGRKAEKKSVVKNVSFKEGRSGKLGFVLVEHQISQNGRLILTEEHDIVYKEAPKSETTVESVNKGLKFAENVREWSQVIHPNPVLLFKYSALTFNGHRIHYDRDFCKTEFGFPGLAVHGPLIATLLIELVRKNLPDASVSEYSFVAKGPIFDFQTFKVEGFKENNTVSLRAVNEDGYEAMTARATIGL